jgi:hypothetical protein
MNHVDHLSAPRRLGARSVTAVHPMSVVLLSQAAQTDISSTPIISTTVCW